MLDATECQKSSPLPGNLGASVKLEGQETRTGFLSLQEQTSRDWEDGETEPPFLTVLRCQMISAGSLNCPLSLFLRIQSPDLGVIRFGIVQGQEVLLGVGSISSPFPNSVLIFSSS